VTREFDRTQLYLYLYCDDGVGAVRVCVHIQQEILRQDGENEEERYGC